MTRNAMTGLWATMKVICHPDCRDKIIHIFKTAYPNDKIPEIRTDELVDRNRFVVFDQDDEPHVCKF